MQANFGIKSGMTFIPVSKVQYPRTSNSVTTEAAKASLFGQKLAYAKPVLPAGSHTFPQNRSRALTIIAATNSHQKKELRAHAGRLAAAKKLCIHQASCLVKDFSGLSLRLLF